MYVSVRPYGKKPAKKAGKKPPKKAGKKPAKAGKRKAKYSLRLFA
jgi:hypothetical protein